MTTSEYRCSNGTNKDVVVEFPENVTELKVESPCPNCVWRSVLDFVLKPEFEGYIALREKSAEYVAAYYKYQEQKTLAQKAASMGNGGIFSWESLHIVRYPQFDNKIACYVERKKQ